MLVLMQAVPLSCHCCLLARQRTHIAFVELKNQHCLLCIKVRKMLGSIQLHSTTGFKTVLYLKSRKTSSIRTGPEALLLLDNCLTHPNENELVFNDGQIVARFLPLNVTSLIQPMNQDFSECLKRIYHKSFLKELVSPTEGDMLAFLKKIDMLSVVEKIANAWEQVSHETLRKSWHKFIPFDKSFVEENATCSESMLNDEFAEQFATLNIELMTSILMAGFKLMAWVINTCTNKESLILFQQQKMKNVMKRIQMRIQDIQHKKALFRTQEQCKCLTVA